MTLACLPATLSHSCKPAATFPARTIVLSANENAIYRGRSLAWPAGGYLPKTAPLEEIAAAVRRVAGGSVLWTDEERSGESTLTPSAIELANRLRLTPRELQVLRLLGQGLSNKEIGQTLHIGYETTKEHVQHAMRKIGVNDRTRAAVWAIRNQLS